MDHAIQMLTQIRREDNPALFVVQLLLRTLFTQLFTIPVRRCMLLLLIVLVCVYLNDSAKSQLQAKKTKQLSAKPGVRSALLQSNHAENQMEINKDCQMNVLMLNTLPLHLAAFGPKTFSRSSLLLFDSAATGKKSLR